MESQPTLVDTSAIPKAQTSSGYDAGVAIKKVAWAITKLVAAQSSAPAAIALFQSTADKLQPLGITVIIDPEILNKALPGLIFMLLVAAHDAVKVRTGSKWL